MPSFAQKNHYITRPVHFAPIKDEQYRRIDLIKKLDSKFCLNCPKKECSGNCKEYRAERQRLKALTIDELKSEVSAI